MQSSLDNDVQTSGLSTPSERPKHILDVLEKAAAAGTGISYLDGGFSKPPTVVTYRELYEEAKLNGSELRQSGIVKPDSIVIAYFDSHQENVLWFWSVIAAGGICAILNPVSNDDKVASTQLEHLKSLFGETPVLTSHKLSSMFSSKGLATYTIESVVKRDSDKVDSPMMNEVDHFNSKDGDAIAAILFTSGSTGHSKAVQFSHAQLIASVEAKAEHLNTYGKKFMSWISFDHSACFCEVHLQAMYVGSDQIFVPTADMVIEPHRFFYVLSQYKIGYTFSPNFFLATATKSFESQLPSEGKNPELDLSHLSVIMCGGEANRTSTLKAADNILRRFGAPAYSIKAAYGLSETCSACFYNLESPERDIADGKTFASAGGRLPKFGVLELKFVDPEDEHKKDAEQGLVHLRGDLIFKGYYNNPEATAACMTEDGWMNTGDIGRLDRHGGLELLGRMKEVVILNGQNYSSFEIEHTIESNKIPGLEVSYTAAFSTWDQKRDSEGVVVLFNPTEAAIGPKNMRATVQAIERTFISAYAQSLMHVIPLPKALLPKSTIGKLSRAKLKQSFERGEFDDFLLETDSGYSSDNGDQSDHSDPWAGVSSLQKEIAEVYSSVVNMPAETLIDGDVLLTSGIDSIGLMRLKRALEKQLKILHEIPMPTLLRCHSIADLERELTLLGTVPQQYDPIVPLSTQGNKQTLFLLHPGGGEFLCWIGLLKYLPDRPIYALRAKGLHPGEGEFEGLEDLLSCYYNAIRRVQPQGPYAMVGYCFGGLLCFELAKMFQQAGEEVNFCGGIDNPPTFKGSVGGIEYRSLIIDILPHLSGLSEEETKVLADQTIGMSDEAFYEFVFKTFSPELIEQMDITVPRLQAWARVEDNMRIIIDKYAANGQVSNMDIFCADPMPSFGHTDFGWRSDVLSQWKGFVQDQDVRFHEVQGNHISLMKDPLVQEFEKVLNKALQERGV